MMKRLLSLLLSAVIISLCAMSAPFCAYAKEGEIYVENDPLKSGCINVKADPLLAESSEIKTIAAEFRKSLITRSTTFETYVDRDAYYYGGWQNFMRTVYAAAYELEDAESSVDGDYLRWSIGAYGISYKFDEKVGKYLITFTTGYYDSRKQELTTHRAINDYLSSLDIDSYTDFELLREFHDHILDICKYNYDNMTDANNFCAYGVFGKGKAVCQGYALAFYRLCREVGIDCCVATSDPKEGCHAWNLVMCGDKYYFVDCTWDDEKFDRFPQDYKGTHCYDYFLVDYETLQANDTDLHQHKLYGKVHDNDYFNNTYRKNISKTCYDEIAMSISNCVVPRDGGSIRFHGMPLKNGVDYTLSQTADNYTVINGKGGFEGTSTTRDMSILTADVSYPTGYEYTGYVIKPTVKVKGLTKNKDYRLLFCDYQAGKATFYVLGIGRYSGVYCADFDIYKSNLSDFKISLSYTETYYNGTEQKPRVIAEGLVENRDFTVKYDAITDVGTGYVYIKGKGSCIGSVTLSYNIVKRNIADERAKLNKTSYEYNGYECKPVVTISGLKLNQDYTVTYKNNVKPGKASVTIKGMGCYGGKQVIYFTIKPKKATIKKLKTSQSSITVTWSKVTGVTGYQVEYSTSSSFKNSKKLTASASDKSKKITKLKKGKRYYVRVRAYKKSGSKNIYGVWSAKKSISCK